MIKSSQKWQFLAKSPLVPIFNICVDSINEAPIIKLGNIVSDIKTGKTPSKEIPEYYDSDYLYWYKPEDIGNKIYLDGTNSFLSEKAVLDNKATIYEKGTILINCIGDIGRVGILNHTASSNQQITGIKFQEQVSMDFMFFFFLSKYYFFKDTTSSTTLPIINQKKLLDLDLKLPDSKNQEHIGRFLMYCMECLEKKIIPDFGRHSFGSEINNKISAIFETYYGEGKIIELLDKNQFLIGKLKSSILQDAIQGKLVPQDPSDEPASILIEKIQVEKIKLIAEGKLKKQKPLAPIEPEEIPYELPKGWEWVRAGGILQTTSGGTPNRGNSSFWGGKIPWLKSGELNDNLNITYSEEHITELGLSSSSAKIFKKGSILLALYGATAGKLGILGIDASTNQAVCSFENISNIERMYLYYFLRGNRDKIIHDSFGGAQPNISQDYVRNMLFPLPPLQEQKRIVEKIDELMKSCELLDEQVKQAKERSEKLMESVLQGVFNG